MNKPTYMAWRMFKAITMPLWAVAFCIGLAILCLVEVIAITYNKWERDYHRRPRK